MLFRVKKNIGEVIALVKLKGEVNLHLINQYKFLVLNYLFVLLILSIECWNLHTHHIHLINHFCNKLGSGNTAASNILKHTRKYWEGELKPEPSRPSESKLRHAYFVTVQIPPRTGMEGYFHQVKRVTDNSRLTKLSAHVFSSL
jgi:hypothetical protein